MTDRNDLRRMLDELADETPEVPTQEWLDGTRHKVRVRRRVRWVGAGVAAALVCAAAVAVVPRVVDDAATRPTPADPAPNPSEPREWQFAEGIDTKRVIASRLNDAGASELTWTRTVRRADLGSVAGLRFCHLPEAAAAGGSEISLVSNIGFARQPCRHWAGYPVIDKTMVTFGFPDGSSHIDAPPDETYRVSMWLERNGQRVVVPGAEFGFALYWECFPSTGERFAGMPRCDKTFDGSGGSDGGEVQKP